MNKIKTIDTNNDGSFTYESNDCTPGMKVSLIKDNNNIIETYCT